jgi:hypothetical protein
MSEFFQLLAASTVAVPAHEVLVVLSLQSLCYLFRVPRLGLLVSCAFVYRLGWCYLHANYGATAMTWFSAYTGLGIFLLALAIYGMIHDSE